jgi:hypothetical protein
VEHGLALALAAGEVAGRAVRLDLRFIGLSSCDSLAFAKE